MSLEDFKDNVSREAHGITKAEAHVKSVCINCKKPPRFKTCEGEAEYRISGMCEDCWDELFSDDDDGDIAGW